MTQGKSAIGSGSNQNVHYNTPAPAIGGQVSDNDQFILLVKSRQSDDFKMWSSGDQTQTKDLFNQARRQVDQLTTV